METSVDFHLKNYIIADRVWEEVVEIYGPNPHINHTQYRNLTRQGRDERSGVLERIYEIVRDEELISFIPIALWPKLDSVNGNWNTTFLKIILRCLSHFAAESRRKSSSSTLPTNVEVPPFGQLSPTAALLPNPQINETAVASRVTSEAPDEMSESCKSNIVPGAFSNKSRQSTSSKASGTKDSSPRPKDSPAKPASSSSPPPPPPVLDAAEEPKHKIAIARAKRDYRKIITEESTKEERMSLEVQKCLLEEVEFDLEAQRAEEILERVHKGAPFEKDVMTDARTSRKRKIAALEVERAERRYEVAKALKLEGKA